MKRAPLKMKTVSFEESPQNGHAATVRVQRSTNVPSAIRSTAVTAVGVVGITFAEDVRAGKWRNCMRMPQTVSSFQLRIDFLRSRIE